MFDVISIFKDNYYLDNKEHILEYCREAYSNMAEPSHENMWNEDWVNKNNTLPYLIYKSDRFKNDNGDMFLLLSNNRIIGNSGVNISTFDSNVAIGGVRTWLNSEFKGGVVIGRYVLTEQLKWCKNKGIKIIALTFNDYNKRLIPYFTRVGLGIQKKRTPDSLFYNGQYIVDFPVLINNTKQWVIYHKLDENYEPDWESIRHKGN